MPKKVVQLGPADARHSPQPRGEAVPAPLPPPTPTLFLMSFGESLTKMAELVSLADILPLSPCSHAYSGQGVACTGVGGELGRGSQALAVQPYIQWSECGCRGVKGELWWGSQALALQPCVAVDEVWSAQM
eukprot:365124-Chlamydomonas_euryale.AAC.16